MSTDLANWGPRSRPSREVIEGRYTVLEPLDPARHGDDLFVASMAPGADERHRWLFEVPSDRMAFDAWMAGRVASDDPLFFAVIDKASGRAEGRQALMRIDPAHGVIEIGNILWGPSIAGTRVATEAQYLFMAHAFETLGYRRYEWKCNDRNEPSKRAAIRFGFSFEGVFRQHMVVKGENRDTAWFSVIHSEWPMLKARYLRWLDPGNFDAQGRQIRRLQDC